MTAQSNREKMPNVAKMVDEVRKVFGPSVKVVYAREGDIELGKRPDHLKAVVPVWSPPVAQKQRKTRV